MVDGSIQSTFRENKMENTKFSFFYQTLKYLEFLQFDSYPLLIILFLNPQKSDLPHDQLFFNKMMHYALPLRGYLDKTFPNHWIGGRGPTKWPARSPDLT